ncbi:hypothetical protein NE237_012599 [Protea cynaroides]|uniref:Uncharacterized protein n=1 Tax=Protea cynaroides TaxID=273540 RepID=A0A9Q0JXS1_9MAGN|nr:hypothetical protein NE237_012599 [Protea cynaroides]
MEADIDMTGADNEEDPNANEDLEEMKKRLKEIEEVAGALREIQAKVEKEMGAVQMLLQHRLKKRKWIHAQYMSVIVTILTDKFGQPKGFAYVEFVEVDAVQNAPVSAKRTDVPGMKQYRGRRPNPYLGFRGRRPMMPGPPFFAPYGFGKVPRFRRPMRYRPYF